MPSSPATGQERQDRCALIAAARPRRTRSMHRRIRVWRHLPSTNADRADHRGHAQLKPSSESCRDQRIREFWNRRSPGSRAAEDRAQAAGRRHPPAPRSRRAARPDRQRGGVGLRPLSPSWCACPRSAASPANKPPRSPALLPMMTTAGIKSEYAISRAVVSGCEKASTPQGSLERLAHRHLRSLIAAESHTRSRSSLAHEKAAHFVNTV